MTELILPEEIGTLGAALRWARRARGLRIRHVADAVGLSFASVQNVEYGVQGTARVAQLEQLLGVKLAHLRVERARITQRERGERAEPRPHSAPSNLCAHCFGMAHRRPRVGLCLCGQRHAEEPELHAEADQRSSAGYVMDRGALEGHGDERATKKRKKECLPPT